MTVLIPAHNEAGVIGGCLESLVAQSIRSAVRIVVVANGCDDDTASVVRSARPGIEARGFELIVEELAWASKPGALNHADKFALSGVRIYMDADIRLSADALTEVVAALGAGQIHLCAPALQVAAARSILTRCYSAIWSKLPVVQTGVVGCGFYAVTENGRHRWSLFPLIISDDKFVRLQFHEHERAVLPNVHFVVQMPEGIGELVRVRGRWCRGNSDISRRYPELQRREVGRMAQALLWLLRTPSLWRYVPVFVLVYVAGLIAALMRRDVGIDTWERASAARLQLSLTAPRASTR